MKNTIGKTLDSIIGEAFTRRNKIHENSDMNQVYLSEKEKQVSLAPKNQSQDSDKPKQNSNKASDGGVNSTDNQDDKALSEVPELEQIIEKLNLIRSGKSLKDSIIQQRFDGYFNDLNSAERVALFAYLKGIAQIVNGDIEPELAQEPGDDPANVKMHKGKKIQQVKKKEKSVEPNLIKKVDKPEGVKTSSEEEDTSSPVIVKKRQ